MRRESSTVVALVGEVGGDLLGGLGRSPNVAVASAPAVPGGAGGTAGNGVTPVHPGWEPGALAMREAAHRRSMYVIVPDDPLAAVAASWQQMWDLSAGQPGSAAFEASAADALAAWRDKRFELPDYYLVVAPVQAVATGPDLYLGPLRAVRPHRVSVAGVTDSRAPTASLLDALRSLEHGPWWPPLDELLGAARRFYAGGLTESQQIARPS
jgi:hypothetical protein